MRNLCLGLFSFLLIQNIVFATDLEELCFGSEKSSSKQVSLIDSDGSPEKSVSFSGGSYFSATYNMGFLKGLQEFLKLDGEDIVYLGDSSGALVALVAVLGLDADYGIDNFLIKTLKETRELPHCGFSQWGKILRKNLLALSAEYKSELKGCAHKLANSRLHISITHFQLFPWPFKNELVSYFDSTEDLIETILTSCHMPWVLGETFFTKWRGKTCVDGGLSNHNPALDENTVRVNPFLWRSPFFWIWHGCFTLHTEEEARRAISWGYEDARKNIQYFLDRGFKPREPSIALPLSVPLPCIEEDGPTAIGVLIKEIHTVWFYGGNIFFSQVRSYLSSAKETVKSLAWSAISAPVKVLSIPVKVICFPFKVLSFFCGR